MAEIPFIFILSALFSSWIFYTVKKKVVPSITLGIINLFIAIFLSWQLSGIKYYYFRSSTKRTYQLLLQKLEKEPKDDVIKALRYALKNPDKQSGTIGSRVIEKLNETPAEQQP